MMNLEHLEKHDSIYGNSGSWGTTPKLEPNKTLLLQCECKAEILSIERDVQYQSIYVTFYKYSSKSFSFWGRFKMAWKVLRGEGLSTADVVLTEEQFSEIKNF